VCASCRFFYPHTLPSSIHILCLVLSTYSALFYPHTLPCSIHILCLVLCLHLVCWSMRILSLVLCADCRFLSFRKRGGDGVDGSARSSRSRTTSVGCYHRSAQGAENHTTARTPTPTPTPTPKSVSHLHARQWALGALVWLQRLLFTHPHPRARSDRRSLEI